MRFLAPGYSADAQNVHAFPLENREIIAVQVRKKRKSCLTGGGHNNFQL
jgi:hypothetical protein